MDPNPAQDSSLQRRLQHNCCLNKTGYKLYCFAKYRNNLRCKTCYVSFNTLQLILLSFEDSCFEVYFFHFQVMVFFQFNLTFFFFTFVLISLRLIYLILKIVVSNDIFDSNSYEFHISVSEWRSHQKVNLIISQVWVSNKIR